MQVREVRRITDRKSRILFEDGSSFVLYNAEVRRYGICEQEELPAETIRRIREDILVKRSRLRCLNLLKRSDRTVEQLRLRLLRDGYPDDIAAQALEYAASFHYTDDRRYAGNYIRQMSGRKSRKQITYDLIGKGVDRETVRAALLDAGLTEQESEAETEAILRLARKRGFEPQTAGREETARFFRYLTGKGFDYELIRSVLRTQDLD